jgi:hypothetical protein
MAANSSSQDTITVVTLDELEGTRSQSGAFTKKLNIRAEELAVNVNLFLDQMGSVVAKTPEAVGNFRLAEIEITAEITGKGQVVLWGIGGEAGASGGIKFVFKR